MFNKSELLFQSNQLLSQLLIRIKFEITKLLEFFNKESNHLDILSFANKQTNQFHNYSNLKDELHERLMPIVIAADLAFDLFDDYEQARAWIMSPNDYFFGNSPFQMAMRKQGEAVISLLNKWLGRLDGQAY